ncbi:MAG: LuxR C-terminal-related transcriptional regulator [Sporichthyaceae bacterium]
MRAAGPDWAERRAATIARSTRLHRRVRTAVGFDPLPGPVLAAADLDSLTAACTDAMTIPGVDARPLGALVADLQDLSLRLREHDLIGGTVRLAEAEAGLARLRACSSTAVLLDRVCPEVTRSCGFARVLLSRVQADHWYPWQVNEAVAGQPWVARWSSNAIALHDGLREGRLLREHRPALVADVHAPDVHPIIREGGSHSYVVAPIVPAGRVLGFLHADHLAEGRRCDETDRDVLWRFAEGFGHLYERTALLEQMRTQRGRVRDLLAAVDVSMAELTEAETELSSPGQSDPSAAWTPAPPGGPENLTPREREVLDLVLAGANNAEIAQRLAIGVGTVKLHVKHVLRKAGAVNRTQVIARYLGGAGTADRDGGS